MTVRMLLKQFKEIFYVNGTAITPPVSEGCLNGVRKQILEIAKS
jgi:branched-subunit amino acid aminotransferase/4-amino-4-deoxychorismate lyase